MMRPTPALCGFAAAAVLAGLPAQTSQASSRKQPNSAEALAKDLDAAHRSKEAPATIRGLEAQIKVSNMVKGKDNISLVLNMKFAAGLERKINKRRLRRDMIRYSMEEGGKVLQRGFDGIDYWMRKGDERTRLSGSTFTQDREKVRKEIALAQQLVQFLDPGAMLRKLQDPSPVKAMDLIIRPPQRAKKTRTAKFPARVVDGRIDQFPFALLPAPQDKKRFGWPARLRIFVDRKTNLLLAVEARCLEPKYATRGELIVMLPKTYRVQQGIKLPFGLQIYQRTGNVHAGQQKISIIGVRLNPGFTWKTFQS